jgi:hypothetical protein
VGCATVVVGVGVPTRLVAVTVGVPMRAVAVGVAVGVGVFAMVGVAVGVGVSPMVGVAVGVEVSPMVGVAVEVGISVGVAEGVGVPVLEAAGVDVSVPVGVGSPLGVASVVSVAVGTIVRVGDGTGVGVDPPVVSLHVERSVSVAARNSLSIPRQRSASSLRGNSLVPMTQVASATTSRDRQSARPTRSCVGWGGVRFAHAAATLAYPRPVVLRRSGKGRTPQRRLRT